MAYEMNDLKGILFLALFAIPMIASMNINCYDKAFHCVNSTHFMICVDLGGGVSTTIDDFVITCPTSTVCHETNIFECEFPKIEVVMPPLEVIGVYKQSDTSEPTIVTDSVTAPTPTSEVLSVFSENVTGTTLPIPEEVTPVLKLEVLENIKKSTEVESENTTETRFLEPSSSINSTNEIHIDELKSNNRITTTATGYNKNFEFAIETAIDKAVLDSLTDKSKSTDTVTSVIGLINLISTDPQSVASTKSSSDILTSIDTLYDNIATTTEQYITKQVTKHDKKVENVTNKLTIPLEIIFSESVSTDEVSPTLLIHSYLNNDINNKTDFNNKNDSVNQNLAVQNSIGKSNSTTYINNKTDFNHKNDSVNQNLAEQNSTGKINSTTEPVQETNTKYFIPTKIVKPGTDDMFFQTTTDNTFDPSRLVDSVSTESKQMVPRPNSTSEHLNTLYDNIATTTEQHVTKQVTKHDKKVENVTNELAISLAKILSDNTNEVSTTPMVNSYIENDINNKTDFNNKNDLVYQTLAQQNSTGENNSTTELVPETTTEYLASTKIVIHSKPVDDVSFKTTTENILIPLVTVNLVSTELLQSVPSTNSSSKDLNTLYDNPVTTNNQNTTKQETKNGNNNKDIVVEYTPKETTLSDRLTTVEQISTTPIVNDHSFYKYDITNQLFTELNSTDEIITTEKIPQTNRKYFIPEQMTVSSFDITTENNFVPIITEGNKTYVTETITTSGDVFNNNSLVEEQTIVAQPLEITITTDSSLDFTDNSYQMNQELNQSLLSPKNNTAGTMKSIKRANTVYSSSSTEILFNNKGTESTLLLTTTNPTVEMLTTENLQNEFTAHETEVKNELLATDDPIIVDDSYIDNVKNYQPLSTTPAPFNKTSISVTNITVKGLTSLSDIVRNAPPQISTVNSSDGYISMDRGTIQKDKTDQENKITDTLNQQENLVAVSLQEKNNTETTLPQISPSNHYVIELTSKSPQTVHTTPITVDSIKISQQMSTNISEIANIERVSTTDYKIETSTTFLVDITHNNNTEVVQDLSITTPPLQEITSQTLDTVKQLNTTNRATETASEMVPFTGTTAGYKLLNTKHIDLNTSDWKDLVNKEAIISKVDPNEASNKIKTINSFYGKNSDNTTSHPPMATSNGDESIKIMSVFDIVNSTANVMSNATMQPSSSNPLISDYYIKTTNSQDSTVDVTTTDHIPGSDLAQVEELGTKDFKDFPKKLEMTVSFTEKNIVNPIIPTTSIMPIIEVNTENLKYVSTEAPLPITIGFKHTYPTNTEVGLVTEKTNNYTFSKQAIRTDLNKLPKAEAETLVISVSGFAPGTTVSPDGLKTGPVYDEITTTKPSAFILSSQNLSQVVKGNNIQVNKESPLLTLKGVETQTFKNDSTTPSHLIFTSTKNSTEPTHTSNAFPQTTFAAGGTTKKDVLPKIKSTDLPQYMKLISDITTKTIIKSLAEPDSMVETIKVDEGEVSEPYLGDTIPSNVMSNNQTIYNNINNSNYSLSLVKKIIDHESMVFETNSKNNTQNRTITATKSVDINRAEIVNHTSVNDWIQSDFNVDSPKLKESSIDQDLTSQSSVSKSSAVLQNQLFLSKSTIVTQFDPKDGKTVNNIENIAAFTANPSHATGTVSAAPKTFTKDKNIDSSVKGNFNISDVKQNQVRTSSENSTDSYYNINNTNTNLTTPYRNLSHNITFNDELEQHLTSRNHAITTEIQSNLNESDKQSNKTSNELTINGTSMHNPNLTSIKLNADSIDKRAITVSASLFNCLNRTRGKYADKKDCRKFYTCIGNLQTIIGTCPNNTVFSEINKQCTRNLSHCVRNNQFRCLFEGRFSDFFKDNIYYICVKNSMNGFLRYKLQCQDDYHLNKIAVKCERNEELSTQSASSVSEKNNDESTQKSKLEKIISKDDFECDDEGKFPYAKDCSKYYVCTKIKEVYRRKIKKCGSDEVFDKKKKKCVDSDSGEC